MAKILLISSAGGHFSELEKIQKKKENKYIVVTEKHGNTIKKEKEIDYFLKYGTRKSLFKYIYIFILNFFKAIKIIAKEKPDFIISTGAHSCVPFMYIGKIFGKKTIYIESYAKVTKASLTYKIIKPVTDLVIVQHEELLKIYKNAKYFGGMY